MTALQSAKFDDYNQRLAKGETLTDREQRDYNTLNAQARKDWEAESERPHYMYGGDYQDVF